MARSHRARSVAPTSRRLVRRSATVVGAIALASSVLANAALPATGMPAWLRFPLEATGMAGHDSDATTLSSDDLAIKVPRDQVFAAVQVRQTTQFLDDATTKSEIEAFATDDDENAEALSKAAGDVPALREHAAAEETGEADVRAGGPETAGPPLGDRNDEGEAPIVAPSDEQPSQPAAPAPEDDDAASVGDDQRDEEDPAPEPTTEAPATEAPRDEEDEDDAADSTPEPEESASEPPVETTPPPTTAPPTTPPPTTAPPTTPPPTTAPPTTPPPTTPPPTTPPPTTPPPTTPPPTTPPPTTPPPTTPPPTTPPPTTPPPTTPPPTNPSELETVRTTLFNLLNNFRASNGLPRLTYSNHLQTVAQNWANNGLRYYPDSAPAARAHNPNYRSQVGWSRSSELVIRNTGGANMNLTSLLHYMHNWWINSSNHRPWMLDPGYTHAGFGFVRGQTGTPWAVALLGTP